MAEPSFAPTFSPTYADNQPSSLILGIGPGTFAIIVLSVALAIIWGFSMTCDLPIQVACRGISTALYGAIFLILVFSPRESKYKQYEESTTDIYDYSVIPRIIIAGITIFFGFVAAIVLLQHHSEKKQLSTTQQDFDAFWVDD
eukprot:gene312-334_t